MEKSKMMRAILHGLRTHGHRLTATPAKLNVTLVKMVWSVSYMAHYVCVGFVCNTVQ